MADYKTDMRDAKFVLFEYLKIQQLQQSEYFKEYGRDDYDQIINEAYRFAQEKIAPTNEDGDRIQAQFKDGKVVLPDSFKDAYKAFADAGWIRAIFPMEWDGMQLPWTINQFMNEIFLGANISFSLTPGLTGGVIGILLDFGTEELQKKFIPKLMDYEWSGTMCLTEAGAGSDVGNSRSTAKKLDNGRYLIEGQKVFITGGDHDSNDNILHLVLARPEGAPKGTKGLGLFVVPKYRVNDDGSLGESNDVKTINIEHKMGIKGSPTCVLQFGDQGKCEGYLLGKETDGFKIMLHMMNEARIMVGAQGLAVGSASYQQALDYANDRLQGSDPSKWRDPKAPRVPIITHPDVRRMLLWIKAATEGLRALLYKTAFHADQAKVATDEKTKEYHNDLMYLFTPICKSYGSDLGFKATDQAMMVYGGYGFTQDYPIEQYMRDGKIASIYEGTNGIQALDLVGRKLTMKKGKLFMTYMNDLGQFVKKTKGHPRIGQWVKILEQSKNKLAELTMRFATVGMQDMSYPMLYASPFLEVFGDVILSHLLLEEALLADTKLTKIYSEAGVKTESDKHAYCEEHPEAKFYYGKVQSARFFVNYTLPQTLGKMEAIKAGDKAPLDMIF